VTTQLTERIDQLTRSRVPFVQATVVRAQEPSSAHAGDRAIVLADGSIEGFVGGQCAAGSVRTAALGTLETGVGILLRVLPDSDDTIWATGQVCHRKADDLAAGLGIRFVAMAQRHARRLRDYCLEERRAHLGGLLARIRTGAA